MYRWGGESGGSLHARVPRSPDRRRVHCAKCFCLNVFCRPSQPRGTHRALLKLEAHAAAAAAVVATGGMPRGNRNRKWCSKLQLQNRRLKILSITNCGGSSSTSFTWRRRRMCASHTRFVSSVVLAELPRKAFIYLHQIFWGGLKTLEAKIIHGVVQ
jgi:hypothetical protein